MAAPRLLRTGLFLLGLVFSALSLEATGTTADQVASCSPGTTLELIESRGQDAAWELLGRRLEAAPDCASLQRDWALISLRTGRLAEARQRLQTLTDLHPHSPAIQFGLGFLNPQFVIRGIDPGEFLSGNTSREHHSVLNAVRQVLGTAKAK